MANGNKNKNKESIKEQQILEVNSRAEEQRKGRSGNPIPKSNASVLHLRCNTENITPALTFK